MKLNNEEVAITRYLIMCAICYLEKGNIGPLYINGEKNLNYSKGFYRFIKKIGSKYKSFKDVNELKYSMCSKKYLKEIEDYWISKNKRLHTNKEKI